MLKHEKSLRRKLDSYLREITKPQKLLEGKPICPGLAQYRHQIHVLMAELDLESQLYKVANLIIPLDVPAVIIATAMPPKDIYDITDRVLNDSHDNLEIFVNDPSARGAVNGVYTGFAHGWLIIVQQKDLLEKARKHTKSRAL